ncbi:MAG: hypothetical protein DRI73_09655 [Bacteroidetes bacterium]|nr:MAG: hypothetical protein DRI73_09655 [Bacteroidota bacterium]
MKFSGYKFEYFLLFAFLLIPKMLYSQEYLLDTKLHLKSNYWKQLKHMAISTNGDHIIAGTFENELEIGGQTIKTQGKRSVFLSASDSTGKIKWMNAFYCSDYSGVEGVMVNDDGIINVLGWFYDSLQIGNTLLSHTGSKNVFISQFDKNGNLNEAKVILHDFQGNFKKSIIGPEEHLFLAGTFKRRISIGSKTYNTKGGEDIFILQISKQGEILNSLTIGGTGKDDIDGLLWVKDKLVVYGMFEKELPLGDTLLRSSGKSDGFLAIFHSTLNYSEGLALGGSSNDEIVAVYSDASANLYLTGSYKRSIHIGQTIYHSQGESDIFYAKLDSNLQFVNVNSWGGKGKDSPTDIFVNKDQQVFISGIYTKPFIIGSDTLTIENRFSNGFLAMTDRTGQTNWVKKFTGKSEEIPNKIYEDGESAILVTGTFYNEMEFDQTRWTAGKSADAFMLKYLDPCSLLKFDLPSEKVICNDQQIILSAGEGYSNYIWKDGYANTESVEIADTGLWWVEITDQYGCHFFDTIHVKKDSLFMTYSVKDEEMPEGNNGSISLTYGGGEAPYNILWYDFEQTASQENLTNGFYQVKITDANGCEINQEIEVGQMVASGILDIRAFPNPMKDFTHILYSIPENTRIQISLYDFSGRKLLVLYSGKKHKGEYGFDWGTSLLREGVYYLQIQTPKGVVSKKIVVNPDHN